jgi:putative redox protein
MQVTVRQVDDRFHFRATNPQGLTVDMDDATAREDGVGKGVSPMQLLVMALGGCTGIDIVSILQKGRQRIDTFEITLEATREEGRAARVWVQVQLHVALTGDLDPEKVRRAIELSLTTYCSVAKSLAPQTQLGYTFSINGTSYS